MNPFQRTELHVAPAQKPITRESNIICAGSCFTTLLGDQLRKYKFKALVQPFGTIFNPITLSELFLAQATDIQQHSFVHNEVSLNFKLNSAPFSASSLEDLNENIETTFQYLHQNIAQATHLVLTLGTAHVYFLKESEVPVSNCHQLPSNIFKQRMLTVEEVEENLKKLVKGLLARNKSLHFIFTVSPVRHVKDKLHINSLSKAVLRVAIDNVCQQFTEASYFPAFELLLDDLRDYRFYESDLIHPGELAENYIWNKFSLAYFSPVQQKEMELLDEILSALSHKPRFPFAESWLNFKAQLKDKLEKLSTTLPLTDEWMRFNNLP